MSEDQEQTHIQSQRVLYQLILISPLTYLLILILLQIDDSPKNTNNITYDFLFLILIIFLFCSAGNIILTYLVLIPIARNIKNQEEKLPINMLILLNGATVISTYSVILGVLWWSSTGNVPFYIVLPFIAFNITHGYYIYIKNLTFEKKE